VKVLKTENMQEKDLIAFVAEINLMKNLRPHGKKKKQTNINKNIR